MSGNWTEKQVTRALRAQPRGDATLLRALESHSSDGRMPSLYLTPDPLPFAHVARSWGGSGRIFLSTGLVHALSEAELRSVLGKARLMLADRKLPFRSLCFALSLSLESKIPPLERLSPIQAIWTGVTLPALRYFKRRANLTGVFSDDSMPLSGEEDIAWIGATHKVQRLKRIHSRPSHWTSQLL